MMSPPEGSGHFMPVGLRLRRPRYRMAVYLTTACLPEAPFSRTEFMQCFSKGFLLGGFQLFDLGLEQRTN